MGKRLIEMTGVRYGSLLVLGRGDNSPQGKPRWRCKCDCGKTGLFSGSSLRGNYRTSCGCGKYRHGHSGHPLYVTWVSMIHRCHNKNCRDYRNYGGRGIVVCDRWRNSVADFVADVGERPQGATLDRIDNDGNYEPGNCRWATRREQNFNKRTNRPRAKNGSVGQGI